MRSPRRWAPAGWERCTAGAQRRGDRKSTRLNSSHDQISYAVFCLKKKKRNQKSERKEHTDEITIAYDLIVRVPGRLSSCRGVNLSFKLPLEYTLTLGDANVRHLIV